MIGDIHRQSTVSIPLSPLGLRTVWRLSPHHPRVKHGRRTPRPAGSLSSDGTTYLSMYSSISKTKLLLEGVGNEYVCIVCIPTTRVGN
jgi:hypothetical protein